MPARERGAADDNRGNNNEDVVRTFDRVDGAAIADIHCAREAADRAHDDERLQPYQASRNAGEFGSVRVRTHGLDAIAEARAVQHEVQAHSQSEEHQPGHRRDAEQLHFEYAEEQARRVGGNDGASLVHHQRQPLEHRIGAERDDDCGKPQAHRYHTVDQPEQAAEGDTCDERNPRVDARRHQDRREHRREVEHPADGQIDLTNGQQEHHPDREHAQECCVPQQREHVLGAEEVRARDADDGDHHKQRNDHADLVWEAETSVA